jgi:hypothetical protein
MDSERNMAWRALEIYGGGDMVLVFDNDGTAS